MSYDLPPWVPQPELADADTEQLVQAARCEPALPPALRRRCVQSALQARELQRLRKWVVGGFALILAAVCYIGQQPGFPGRNVQQSLPTTVPSSEDLHEAVHSPEIDWQLVEEKQRLKRQTLAAMRNSL